MPEYNKISKLFFEPKGTHNPDEAYSIMDVVTAKDGSAAFAALQDVPAGVALDDAGYWKSIVDVSPVMTSMQAAIKDFGSAAKEVGMRVKGEVSSATGNPAAFLPDAGSLLDVTTMIEPKQEGEGDASRDNIRAISGWSTMTANHSGKNLAGLALTEATTKNGVTLTPSADGTLTLNGTASASTTFNIALLNPIPAGSYTLSLNNPKATTGSCYVALRSASGNAGMDGGFKAANRVSKATTTAEAVRIWIVIVAGEVLEDFKFAIQVESGSVATAFEPYQNEQHVASFNEMVYGGSANWMTGALTEDWHLEAFTGASDEKWTKSSTQTPEGYYRYDRTASGSKTAVGNECLSSHATYWGVNNKDESGKYVAKDGVWVTGTITSNNTTLGVRFVVPFATVDEWKAYLAEQYAAGTPVQVAYRVKAPDVRQFTPSVFAALEPEKVNAISGDGEITVEYVKPLHVSIDERIAAALAAASGKE